jgi:hypothetical protein
MTLKGQYFKKIEWGLYTALSACIENTLKGDKSIKILHISVNNTVGQHEKKNLRSSLSVLDRFD